MSIDTLDLCAELFYIIGNSFVVVACPLTVSNTRLLLNSILNAPFSGPPPVVPALRI